MPDTRNSDDQPHKAAYNQVVKPVIEVGTEAVRVGDESRPRRFHDHSIRGWIFVDGSVVGAGDWDTRAWTADEIARWKEWDRFYRSWRGRTMRALARLARPLTRAAVYDDPYDYDDEYDNRTPARGFWPSVARRAPAVKAAALLVDASARWQSDGSVAILGCSVDV